MLTAGLNSVMAEGLQVSVPVYEGPLDLLLDMIRNQRIDIYDIPVARITQQYLDYIHALEEMNVESASEFLYHGCPVDLHQISNAGAGRSYRP